MRNRQIQEERIKTYFLDSAKNLLRAEGLKGVSVRNVAYRAGYSYATLYNYFKDINDLLFRCVEDFCQEVGDFVAARTEGGAPGREGLRRTARAYVEYFVEYPGVFELFFLERLGGFGDRTETAALITGLLGRLCEPRLAECIADGTTRPERRLPWRRGFAACCRVCCCSTRTGSPPTITRSSCSRSMRSSAG